MTVLQAVLQGLFFAGLQVFLLGCRAGRGSMGLNSIATCRNNFDLQISQLLDANRRLKLDKSPSKTGIYAFC